MTKPFFIRTAMQQDIAAIHDLLVETWHDTYDSTFGVDRVIELTGKWHSLERLEARLTLPHSEFLVADNGEQIGGIGFASAKDKLISLQQLYVLPKFQGKGIGSELLLELENSFPECDRIGLEVERDNDKAVAFYTGQGFATISEAAHCMEEGSNIPTFRMEKVIVYMD